MFKRLKYLIKLTSCFRAYKKSSIHNALQLSSNVKLVSANSGGKTPHFLFCVDQIPGKEKLLVKIIAKKGDLSIEKEFAAFEILNAIKPVTTGFRYPRIHGHDVSVPVIVMDYVSSPSVYKLLLDEKSTVRPYEILESIVDWLRQLHDIRDAELSIWSAGTAHGFLRGDDKVHEIQNTRFREFAQDLLMSLRNEAQSIADVEIVKSFSHGDAHLGNFIWDGAELYGFDFSEWAYRVPEYDLAQLAFAFAFHCDDSFLSICERVYVLYPSIDKHRLIFMTKVMAANRLVLTMCEGASFAQEKDNTVDVSERTAAFFGKSLPQP